MGQLYRTDPCSEPERAFRDLRQTEPHPSKPSQNITAEIQHLLRNRFFLINERENKGLVKKRKIHDSLHATDFISFQGK